MHNPIEIIDQYALSVARQFDVLVYSLEGMFEKTVRENSSNRGMIEFMMLANTVGNQSIVTAINQLGDAQESLLRTMRSSEQTFVLSDSDNALDVESAQMTLGTLVTQSNLFYLRKLRQVIAGKFSNIDTYNHEPKIMIKNGARWNFSDYAYLLVRQWLIDWYNNTKIAYFESVGAKEFTLFTENQDLLDSSYLIEDYPLIADKLFHPRTTKLVGDYVST